MRSETNMPHSKAPWTLPKTFPRRFSLVRSATIPLHIGLRAARKKPLKARTTIIIVKLGTKAKQVAEMPSPKQPTMRIVFFSRVPRSAKAAQKGPAKLVKIICTVVSAAK